MRGPARFVEPADRRTRLTAVVTMAVFVALVSVPGVFQVTRGAWRNEAGRWAKWLEDEPSLSVALRKIEGDFDARFLLGRTIRAWLAEAAPGLPATAAVPGSEAGVDGWIFVAVDAQVPRAVGFMNPRLPAPTRARLAIVDLSRRLRRRGIHLLVVPLTARASIYPDKLDPSYPLSRGPDLNVDHDAWFAALRDGGVDALDLTDRLWQERLAADLDPSRAPFLPADSHWSFHGLEAAANAVAEHLAPRLRELPRAVGRRVERVERSREPDLGGEQAERSPTADRERHLITETRGYLLDATGRTDLAIDRGAPILVLGDSNAALFADDGSGFPQTLSAATDVAVRSAAVVGGSATTMRQMLAEPDVLRNVRVVVWVFTMRHLIAGDWRTLPVGTPTP